MVSALVIYWFIKAKFIGIVCFIVGECLGLLLGLRLGLRFRLFCFILHRLDILGDVGLVKVNVTQVGFIREYSTLKKTEGITDSRDKSLTLFNDKSIKNNGILDSFIGKYHAFYYKNIVELHGEFDKVKKGEPNYEANFALLKKLQRDIELHLGKYFEKEENFYLNAFNISKIAALPENTFWYLVLGLVESDGSISFKLESITISLKFNNAMLLYAIFERLEAYCESKGIVGKAVSYTFYSRYRGRGDTVRVNREFELFEEAVDNGMNLKKAKKSFLAGDFEDNTGVNYLSGCCCLRVGKKGFNAIMAELEKRKFVGLEKEGMDILKKKGRVLGKLEVGMFGDGRVVGLILGDGSLVKASRRGSVSLGGDLGLSCTDNFALGFDFSYTLKSSDRAWEFLEILGGYLEKIGGVVSKRVVSNGKDVVLHVRGNKVLLDYFERNLIGVKAGEAKALQGLKAVGGNSDCLEVFREVEDLRVTNSRSLKSVMCDEAYVRLTKTFIWCLLKEVWSGRINLDSGWAAYRGILLLLAKVRMGKIEENAALTKKVVNERLLSVREKKLGITTSKKKVGKGGKGGSK